MPPPEAILALERRSRVLADACAAQARAQAGIGGNRCGHDPARPRIYDIAPPAGRNPNRPALIDKARGAILAFYEESRDPRWDAISQTERRLRAGQRIAAAGGAHTPAGRELATRLQKWRQQRSERREAVTAVLSFVLLYTDIATLRVGIPGPNGALWGLSSAWIAEHTGLSVSRVKRALATLARAGLLTTSGEGRHLDPERGWVYRGWGSVRRLHFRLIRTLGLTLAWEREQKRLLKEKRARAEVDTQARAAENSTLIKGLLEQARLKRLPSSRKQAQMRERAIERNRRLAECMAAGVPLEELRRLRTATEPP